MHAHSGSFPQHNFQQRRLPLRVHPLQLEPLVGRPEQGLPFRAGALLGAQSHQHHDVLPAHRALLVQRRPVTQARQHPVADKHGRSRGCGLEAGHERAEDGGRIGVGPVVEDVAEEECRDGVAAGLLRLKEVVLQQLDAAGHGRVLLGEEAPGLGEHFLAVLNAEGEVLEPARQRDRDVSAAAAHVDHCAPEGAPWEHIPECARFAVDWEARSVSHCTAVKEEVEGSRRTGCNTRHGLGKPGSMLWVFLVVLKHGRTQTRRKGRMDEVRDLRGGLDAVGR